jgi:hypothetical protein
VVKDYPDRKKEFKHASIAVVKADQGTLLVTAAATYIPIDQFKAILLILNVHLFRKGRNAFPADLAD